ncbi:MAG: hypothetical protein IPN69_02745 [Acidobacteria bacterium]|nr:hypothetical protein [Acidobacteriota bacterium]MBK8809632.1 hypothetical protein [Acidobacteriota bacterium]
MSEEAVLRRLRTVDRLRELCLILKKAKFVTVEKAAEAKKRHDRKKHK